MKKIKALMIDDCYSEFLIVKRLFEKAALEYEVVWEADYNTALEKMGSNEYDVFLVDYYLGNYSGIDLIKSAKAGGCAIPILLLTGCGNKDVDLEALRAGADDYLLKDEMSFHYFEKSIRFAIERRKNERTVTGHQIKLSHSLKMSALGELASGIAHEINNPLAIIIGIAETSCLKVEKNLISEEKIQISFQKIIKMSERIAKLAKGLKSFSRNSSDDPFQESSVAEILEESSELCLSKIKFAGVKLESQGFNEATIINCRQGEIVQILVNLISNAVDAIEKQENPWIKIECKNLENCVKILVTDSGSGISKSLQEKILLPYFSTKEAGKGTGLGLSICKMIAQTHSGDLYVNNDSENTQFVVELPYSPAEDSKQPLKILIVDDEENLRFILQETFEGYGCEVLTAASGDEVLDIFSNNQVDVIVTDINMPGISGITLSEEIYTITKSMDAKPKIIFITGYGALQIPKDIFPDLETSVFHKPFDLEALVGVAFEGTPLEKSIAKAS